MFRVTTAVDGTGAGYAVNKLRSGRSGIRIPSGTIKISCPCSNRPGCIWVSARLLFSGYRGSFQGLEVGYSPPLRIGVKNEWPSTSTPSIRLIGVDKNYFTFIFILRST